MATDGYLTIDSLHERVDQNVCVNAWVRTIRKQGGIQFVLLRDITGIIQGVVTKSQTQVFEKLLEITPESVIQVSGTVHQQDRAPGGLELAIDDLTLLVKSESPLPIPISAEKGNEAAAPLRLDWRWLDLRNPENALIFKVWTEFERGFRKYIYANNFIQIYSPSFMSSPSESGSEVFEVNYFEKKAYLAQSPQFYKQMAMAAGFEKVFLTGPVFRAEPSFTTRHMTEFTGWDFEISFIDSHYDVMKVEEDMIVDGFTQVKVTRLPNLEIPVTPFPKLTMKEAKEKLKAAGIRSEKEGDLNPEEERMICEIIKSETNSDFLFVVDYPIDVRPFYHMRHSDNPMLTKSFDLLYKGIEITTGAQREHRLEVLMDQAKQKGMDLQSLENYFNFFRYGCPPHGGAGIGPGRIIMKILDVESVKEVTFLPRDVNRLTP